MNFVGSNNQININNNGLILYTPLGMTMPLRTFNFKVKEKYNDVHPLNHCNQTTRSFTAFDSLALELEMKLAKAGKFTIQIYEEYKGNFRLLILNQKISRICQIYIEQTNLDIIQLIFKEIYNDLPSLLVHPYANYFCLKLYYFLNLKNRIIFLTYIKESFIALCVNKISTYPIQCIIEKITGEEQKFIFASIQGKYQELAIDLYGAHILDKILRFFNPDLIQPLSLFIIDNFKIIASNQNSLCLAKSILKIEYKKSLFKKLKYELKRNALDLAMDPYGNYAVQTAITEWEEADFEEIICKFYGKCFSLSIQKFASNVIEKCIKYSSKFMGYFLYEITNKQGVFLSMMQNYFGASVIQVAMANSNDETKKLIISLIKKNLDFIENVKVFHKWQYILNINNEYVSTNKSVVEVFHSLCINRRNKNDDQL